MACFSKQTGINKIINPGSSFKRLFSGIITGKRQQLQPPAQQPDALLSPEVEAAVMQMLTYSFAGSVALIESKMNTFLEQTGINEIMATSYIYNQELRIKSYRIFSEVMQRIKVKAPEAWFPPATKP